MKAERRRTGAGDDTRMVSSPLRSYQPKQAGKTTDGVRRSSSEQRHIPERCPNIMPGPDFLNSLISVLFKFRQHRVAYAGDIRQMFHHVRIRAADQPAQRFQWRGTDRQRKPDVYQMEAMTFGAVCSPSSAQHVMRRKAEDFAERYPDAVRAVNDNHYMDDYLDSSPSEKQAIEKVHQIIQIHNAGGFEIRTWTSNSRDVLDQIPLQLRSAKALNFDSGTEQRVDRALGLKWNPK